MKSMLREGRILFACVLCLSRCHTVLKKNEKMSLRILPKWRCVPIVVMSQNEFRDSITEDRGGFECCDGIRIPYMEK